MKQFFTTTLFALCGCLAFMSNTALAHTFSSRLLFTARLQGSQQVPANPTTANGVASFMLNATRDTMQVSINMTGLKATAIHIHEGAVGANGGVIKDFTPMLRGNIVRTMLTGADLAPANLIKWLSGAYYINVHTAANPNGEIRGQITLESDKSYYANLTGAQSVPAVATAATAYGIFALDKSTRMVNFKVVAQGLSGAITSSHLHIGAAGTAGGVSLDLSPMIMGNRIEGSFMVTWATASFLTDLAAGNIYINIHTAANPNGEIRGQLIQNTGALVFDAMLDNAQTGGTTAPNAHGVAKLALSPMMDAITYNIATTGLSGAIASAHIHIGVAGTAGGVAITLPAADANGMISGTINAANGLTPALVNMMLEGELYINIHTAANPNGEARGQIMKLAREGFIAEANAMQLTTNSGSGAMGGGMVSIDRNFMNAHYMIAADNFASPIAAAHFHMGAMGTNGGVIYTLPTTAGMYGYWNRDDATPFDIASGHAFPDNNVYVVYHTNANPNGDIRGQFIGDYMISAPTMMPMAMPQPKLSDCLLFSARLQGSQEVPAVTTTANGVAAFMLNAAHDTMQVNINVTGIVATGIHIHEAAIGANGAVIKDFTPNMNGNIVRTILTGADLAPANLMKWLSGAYYLNVHTAANPNGEIRGQIILETDVAYFADLTSAQSVPAVNTLATASAVFALDKSGRMVNYKVVAQGLSGAITASHLHIGAAGTAGGVAVDLSSNIIANKIEGAFMVSAANASFMTDLAAGNIYINIHTAANPNGEIRGQLMKLGGALKFDARLDNMQVGGSTVPSDGHGVARLALAATLDAITYSIATSTLTSPIASAHIHTGAAGTAGGVVVTLAAADAFGMITGTITPANGLTPMLISEMLKGNLYINVHTNNNAATGEIRGQIMKFAREGAIAEISAAQLMPAGTSMARGGGMVTLDRNFKNAHYMIAADGFTSPITAAHFHKQARMQNGGVVYTLPSTAGMYGYWNSDDANPLMFEMAKDFMQDSIYVVYHTTANPNGDVRGQFGANYMITMVTTDVESTLAYTQNALLFPNPTTNGITLQLATAATENITIHVSDILGKTVTTQTMSAGTSLSPINFQTFTNGIYFVQLRTAGGLLLNTYKVVKN
jgi:hypothetical protein